MVDADGIGSIKYQWQSSYDGLNWLNISSNDLEGELKKNFSGFRRLNLYTNFDGTSSGKAQVLFDTFENAQICMKSIKDTFIFGKKKLHVTWNMAPILNKNK